MHIMDLSIFQNDATVHTSTLLPSASIIPIAVNSLLASDILLQLQDDQLTSMRRW